MINVKDLVKQFGSRQAVRGVSFDVNRGVVLGFLGPNGAGKTTTMRMITGFLQPTSGSVMVNGSSVTENPVAVRKHIGYLPENAPLYDDMTVEAFLRFASEMRGFTGSDRDYKADAVIEKCMLGPVRNQTIDTLSKGYKQRTCFAQAILHDPPLLILDEPTEGLDPNQKHVVRSMIKEMGQEKVIILSTHVLEEVEAICSRVIIISSGKLVADSTPAELKKKSSSYNALTLQVKAPEDEAHTAFSGLSGLANLTVHKNDEDLHIRLFPKDGQSIALPALELTRSKGWEVINLKADDGRLDDVFQRITTTEDVEMRS